MTKVELYQKWASSKAQLKSLIVDNLAEHTIPALETRVENFLNGLGHELEQAALKELRGEVDPTPPQV